MDTINRHIVLIIIIIIIGVCAASPPPLSALAALELSDDDSPRTLGLMKRAEKPTTAAKNNEEEKGRDHFTGAAHRVRGWLSSRAVSMGGVDGQKVQGSRRNFSRQAGVPAAPLRNGSKTSLPPL